MRAGDQLWIVDETSRLRNRKVTLLRTGGDNIYIRSGLDEGDLVSLTVLDNSFDSARVDVVSTIPSNQLDLRPSSESPSLESVSGETRQISRSETTRSEQSATEPG